MDGRYGDSTRSVKAIGVPRRFRVQPVAPQPVTAAAYPHVPRARARLDSYGRYHNPTWRQLESALAELEGAAAALTFGSGMAAITSTLRALAKPGIALVVPADGYYQVRRYAAEYLAPQSITVIEASCAEIIDAAEDADVVLAETPIEPRPGRRRPSPAGHDRAGRAARRSRRQHDGDTTGATASGAGCRPRRGQRHQGAFGSQRLLAGYVAGSRPTRWPPGTRTPARGTDPRRVRGVAGAAQHRQLRACGSSGSARTRWRWPLMLRSHPAVRAVRYPGLTGRPVARGRRPARCAVRRHRGRIELATRRRCTIWCSTATCWWPRPASGASTLPWTVAPGGATRSRRASPASRPASRTPTIWSPTSTRRCRVRDNQGRRDDERRPKVLKPLFTAAGSCGPRPGGSLSRL